MGLLDWITEGLGNMGASASPGTMPPDMMGSPPPDAPPPVPGQDPTAPSTAAPLPTSGDFDQNGLPSPRPPGGMPPPPQFAQGADPMTAGGAPPNGPGLPPPGPVPMPMPRPPQGNQAAIADMKLGADGQPMTPAEGNRIYDSYKAAGGGGPVQIYGSSQPPDAPVGGGTPGPNGKLNDSSSWIGKQLGLDSNKEKSLFGSLGQGLTAAGNSKGKSKGQALFSGAGGAIEGGNKAEDKSYDQRLKALNLAVAAQKAGDTAAYQLNYQKYLGAKLKADTDKASGKTGAWNKPDTQKYNDALAATDRSLIVKDAAKAVEDARKNGTPEEVAKAQANLAQVYNKTKQENLQAAQISPKAAAAMSQNPPGTRDNPHVVTGKEDFDRYVKPGDVYINPRDGKPYVRKGAGDGASDSTASEAPSATPEAPGPSPESSGVSDGDEREDGV